MTICINLFSKHSLDVTVQGSKTSTYFEEFVLGKPDKKKRKEKDKYNAV